MTEPGPDDELPDMARVFDHYLGGTENLAVDREFAAEVDVLMPRMRALCVAHREMSGAAVEYLARAGVRQFLELGSGLPSVDHVHTRASRHHHDRRVVYVDTSPVAVAHGRALVADHPGVAVLQADAGDAAAVLASPEVTSTLDLAEPLGVLACGILHYLDDATARSAMATYRAALAPGGGLVISHLTGAARPDIVTWAEFPHHGWSYAPRLRDPEQMADWLDGLELVGPGWASAPHWAADGPVPDARATGSGVWGVLARRAGGDGARR